MFDIKLNKWGLGGSADTSNTLHVYGNAISTNINSLITNITSLEAICSTFINNITLGTSNSNSKAVNSTSWAYTGVSYTLNARDLVIYRSSRTSGGCKGLRLSSSSTSNSAGSTSEAYTTSEASGVNFICPITLWVGSSTTRYLWVQRSTASSTADSYYIQKIGHVFN